MSQVEVVTHDRVCHGAVADIPPALARFLGDVSGVAEFVGEKVGGRDTCLVTRDCVLCPGDVLPTRGLLDTGHQEQHVAARGFSAGERRLRDLKLTSF